MEIPQIKDKITARAFALAMAVEYRGSIVRGSAKYSLVGSTIEQARDFEKYLIGDAKLPEIVEDPTKDWVNTLNNIYKKQAEEEREKRDKDWEEMKKHFPIIDDSLNSENNEADTTKL